MTAQIISLSTYRETEKALDAALLDVVNATLVVVRRYQAETKRLERERDDTAWRMPCDGEVPFGHAS